MTIDYGPNDMLKGSYEFDDGDRAFWHRFLAPDIPQYLPHGEDVLIAVFPGVAAEGDPPPPDVKVYVGALPARFYHIEVGDHILNTGTVGVSIVYQLALLLSQDLLAINHHPEVGVAATCSASSKRSRTSGSN